MTASIRPRHGFTALEIDALEDRLYEHNLAATGHADGRGLGFEVLNEAGAQVGAIAGHSWGGVAYVGQLWVDPPYRRRGWGLKLLDAAIAEAQSRGCRQMLLMTYDFQAPWLYEKRVFSDWSRSPIGRRATRTSSCAWRSALRPATRCDAAGPLAHPHAPGARRYGPRRDVTSAARRRRLLGGAPWYFRDQSAPSSSTWTAFSSKPNR